MSKRVELNDFIKDNYQLIATIGVFGALTALFVRIEGFEFIAFIPLMIFFVLTWELLDSFPDIKLPLKNSSYKLAIFEVLMIILLLGVAWFILAEYVTLYYQLILFAIFVSVFVYVPIAIVDRTKVYERIKNRIGKGSHKFLKIGSTVLLVGIAMILASYLTNLIIGLFS
jgi:hypothetical protein